MFNQPKILVLDIETAPMLAYVWGRKDVNIALNQIHSEWYILAWAAKWLNDPASKIIYRDLKHAKQLDNDREILIPLWKLLDEADIVVTQNGQSFDIPKIKTRFIMHGMPPPSPVVHLDTYRIARRFAAFTSYKLEYLTEKLCTKYKKLAHTKFPGQSLWTECLKGNKKAWAEMKKYNIHDVLSTEELYLKLRPWTPDSMPNAHYVKDKSKTCTKCGGTKLHGNGVRITKIGLRQRYICNTCGGHQTGDKI